MMRESYDIERRHYIGQLDMDFEPGVFPAQWDLTDLPDMPQKLTGTKINPVEFKSHPSGSLPVEQPVSKMVDFYDRVITPDTWKWCGY